MSPLVCLQGSCPLQPGHQAPLGPSKTATARCTQAPGTWWPPLESCPLPCTQHLRGRNPLWRRCSLQQSSVRQCRLAWQLEQQRDCLMAPCNNCLSTGGAALLRDGQPRPCRSMKAAVLPVLLLLLSMGAFRDPAPSAQCACMLPRKADRCCRLPAASCHLQCPFHCCFC